MASKKFMVDLNLNLNELQNAVIQNLIADPEGAELKEARFWYNSTSKQLKFHNGTAVFTLAVGSDLTSAVTRAIAAAAANTLMVSAGADRSAKSYSGGAGIIKSDADGVVAPATAGTDYLTDSSANTLTNKTIDANGTGNSITNLEVADFAASALATNVDTATSSQLVTGEKIKTYVDAKVAGLGQLVPGGFDASSGDLPVTGSGLSSAIEAGDYWRITVQGTIAGLGLLEVGDALVASVSGADEASEFFVLQANLTDAVTSDGNPVTANSIPVASGTTGRIIKGSSVTIDASGSVNIPAGQAFKVNNIDILTANARKYGAAFNGTTDWVGASAPFTITTAAATHALGASADLNVIVKDSSGDVVEVDVNVSGSGDVIISSNAKFAGRIGIIG